MTTTGRVITGITRTVGCVAAVAATTLGPCHTEPASPRPVLPASTGCAAAPVTSTAASWYAVPLESLGGRTLARYVADHESRVLAAVRG